MMTNHLCSVLFVFRLLVLFVILPDKGVELDCIHEANIHKLFTYWKMVAVIKLKLWLRSWLWLLCSWCTLSSDKCSDFIDPTLVHLEGGSDPLATGTLLSGPFERP